MTHQRQYSDVKSAAAAGSNDTVVTSIAQELVCGGKINIILIQD